MKTARRSSAEWLFVACGVWLICLGAYFIFVRPPLLPEDLRYTGANALVLHAAAPRIADWLNLVFTVMGGFMAGAGAMVAYLAWAVLRSRPRGAAVILALAGCATVGLMSAVNFVLHSDFRWLLVVPPVLWAMALARYAYEGRPRAG
jgi:hypothetical protein